MWQKFIIKFVAFVENSVISISIHFRPVLFIYSDLRPYDPSKHSRGNYLGWMDSICPGPHFNPSVQPPPLNFILWLQLTPPPKKNVILRGAHSKFCAQGPEFLATALVGGARDGDWRRCLSNHITFLQKSSLRFVKKHSYFMQAVCSLLWTDCFETYMVVT